MTKKDSKRFKSLLTKEKKKLEKRVAKLKHVDFGDDIDSGEEDSDEVEELVTNNALLIIFNKRLKGINDALAKIDKGTNGACEECKKKISVKLLKIDPESKLCQNCKIKRG